MQLTELQAHLDELLQAPHLRDYCPNGLQVEGRAEIQRVLCGVTASQALLDYAVTNCFDAIFVHHGYFWRGEDGRVVGMRRRRLATLLKNDINLFAYHLPLDAHPTLGNNAQLGALMGWTPGGCFGEQGIGWVGMLPETQRTAGAVVNALQVGLARIPLLIGDPDRPVQRIAWCTGGAQGYFEQAILAGADIYVSGEISEQTVHIAREAGVPYVAAGHHATERYGARAIAQYLTTVLGLEAEFLDLDNPV